MHTATRSPRLAAGVEQGFGHGFGAPGQFAVAQLRGALDQRHTLGCSRGLAPERLMQQAGGQRRGSLVHQLALQALGRRQLQAVIQGPGRGLPGQALEQAFEGVEQRIQQGLAEHPFADVPVDRQAVVTLADLAVDQHLGRLADAEHQLGTGHEGPAAALAAGPRVLVKA